jgi:hypothetical protein
MRSSMAYFAGVGTVVVAIAGGLGGGVLISSIVSPHQPKQGGTEMTRLERRMSPEPIQAMNGSSEPVPYLAESQVSAAVAEAAKQPASPQPPQSQPQPPAQPQTAEQPVETKQPAPPSPPAAQSVTTAEQPAARERPAAEDSFGKARDGDLRRDARRAEERRKAERRQQWGEKPQWSDKPQWSEKQQWGEKSQWGDKQQASEKQQWSEKRRLRPREDDDLRDVEQRVREVTGPREAFAAERGRIEMPRIRLFDSE